MLFKDKIMMIIGHLTKQYLRYKNHNKFETETRVILNYKKKGRGENQFSTPKILLYAITTPGELQTIQNTLNMRHPPIIGFSQKPLPTIKFNSSHNMRKITTPIGKNNRILLHSQIDQTTLFIIKSK